MNFDYIYDKGHWIINASTKRHVWRTAIKAVLSFIATAIVMTVFAWALVKGWERQEYVDQARRAHHMQVKMSGENYSPGHEYYRSQREIRR